MGTATAAAAAAAHRTALTAGRGRTKDATEGAVPGVTGFLKLVGVLIQFDPPRAAKITSRPIPNRFPPFFLHAQTCYGEKMHLPSSNRNFELEREVESVNKTGAFWLTQNSQHASTA